ncbi:MAG: CvpA family protein [Oscillospiraceae bacterium]|nr:CvpA family protein [Oscillospiraceae bacterium]
MRLIIDIVLLLIVALSIWGGYKKGLLGGVIGILMILVSLFAANYVASGYAGDVVPALKPFVDGYIDSQKTRDQILEKMGYGNTDLSLDDVLASDSSLRYDYAIHCMKMLGFHESRAEELAETAVSYQNEGDVSMTEAVIAVLCDTITYVAVLTISFLLILIILAAIGNVVNLTFRLPNNLELLDELGGALLGFVKGFLYCILLCWLLSFLGLLIGKETLDHTTLGKFFLAFRFLTKGLL